MRTYLNGIPCFLRALRGAAPPVIAGGADRIIAKGRGAFESLREASGRTVFFLHIPKRIPVAARVGCPQGGWPLWPVKEFKP